MTIRQGILNQVETDLVNMQAQYGYELNYTKFVKGYIPAMQVKNYPCVWYEFGVEKITKVGEGRFQQRAEQNFAIGIHIKADKLRGELTDTAEQVINDMKRFINKDVSISGYATSDHKVLNLNKVMSDNAAGAVGVQSWYIDEVYTVLDNAEGSGEIIFSIKIIYLDLSNSINNYASL